jgi:hypothetical protein
MAAAMNTSKRPGWLKTAFILLLIIVLGLAAFLVYSAVSRHELHSAGSKPEYIAALSTAMETGSHPGRATSDDIYVNKSDAIIEIQIDDGFMLPDDMNRLYPTFNTARQAVGSDFLPSIETIDAYTKQTDDSLLTELEQYIHTGSSICPGGKQGFLQELLKELLSAPAQPGQDTASAFIAAAVQLGGDQPSAPAPVLKQAQRIATDFLGQSMLSKPIGAYTGNAKLKRIFQRDRLLQKVFVASQGTGNPPAGNLYPDGYMPVVRMAEALQRRPDLQKAYQAFLLLGQRLSNPCADLQLEDLLKYRQYFGDEAKLAAALIDSPEGKLAQQAGAGVSLEFGVAVWPFASSKENRLWDKVNIWDTGHGRSTAKEDGTSAAGGSTEPGVKAVDVFIEAIQSGDVSLEPQPDSGWYDYQLYALETLAAPQRGQEYGKLIYSKQYLERLMDVFAALMANRRETQVKDLGIGVDKCISPIVVSPELHIEPALTHYLRTARGYRFLKQSLADVFGKDELQQVMLAGGSQSVGARLDAAITLFYGLYLLGCDDVGLKPALAEDEPLATGQPAPLDASQDARFSITRLPGLTPDAIAGYQASCATAKQWVEALGGDPVMNADTRIIVPIRIFDYTVTRYMAILGVRNRYITIGYTNPPRIMDATGHKLEGTRVINMPQSYVIPTLVYREVNLGMRPPTREEFRAICDKGQTEEQIVRLLKEKF